MDTASRPTPPKGASPGPAEELRRIRSAMPALLRNWQNLLASKQSPLPLLLAGGDTRVVRVPDPSWDPPASWFFIGDLHGDFFALHTLLQFAEAQCPDCRIGFLGDIVDRGDYHLECVFLLLDWAARHPGRLLWVAGNHDLAFSFDEQSGRFASRVSPADFLDVLNRDDALAGLRAEIGRFFIDLVALLPRAALFPDGLLMTHGGMPLRDLQEQGALAETVEGFVAWLESEPCLKDFAWTRIHRAAKKIPNRHSSDPQYGHTDFEAFCALRPEWFPVLRMIGGHVHPVTGYEVHSSYAVNPALTLVGFGFDDGFDPPASYHHYRDSLHIARYVPDQLPQVIPVPVDRVALRDMYPMPINHDHAAPASGAEENEECPPPT